jgi:GTP-binding protein
VDEPTMTMVFEVNKSPFAGKEGKFVTSRQIGDRLARELKTNVALRVEPMSAGDQFKVSGRGLLHLSILLENMRREGYEIAVSRPQVITKEVDGEICEPYETLVADVEEAHQGSTIQGLAERGGKMQNMVPDGRGRVRLEYIIPSRGLIGFQTEFMSMTSGSGLLFHNFDHFGPRTEATGIGQRHNGVLISNEQGKVLAYALFNLQDRGRMMASPGDEVYEGQVVGIHSRDNDLVVNVLKGKKLTNMRASGSDENVILTPAVRFSLEQALEFINDDELVELTPQSIRVRKKFLKEHERKKAERAD